MYEFISGRIADLTPAYAVVEAAGVGYYLNISLQTFSAIERSQEARLYVHFIVREDAQILYGFATVQERDVFRRLLGVSGVGGNTARMVLSTYSPGELAGIIAADNAALLKNVKGLGLKTAEKIIVELRDKMTGFASSSGGSLGLGDVSGDLSGVHSEALAALAMLGFSRAASDKVIRSIIKDSPDLSVEDVIRRALKKL